MKKTVMTILISFVLLISVGVRAAEEFSCNDVWGQIEISKKWYFLDANKPALDELKDAIVMEESRFQNEPPSKNPRESFSAIGVCDNALLGHMIVQAGTLRSYLGDEEGALKEFEKAMALPYPEYTGAYNGMAFTLASYRGDISDNVLSMAQRAVKTDSASFEVWDTVGFIQYMRGEYEDSLKSFKTSLALEPDCKELWEHLGNLYIAMNNKKGADLAFAKALKARSMKN